MTAQPNLFDAPEERTRVAGKLGEAILFYLRAVLQSGGEFTANELRIYVEHSIGHVAPGSADRILRLLRKEGRVDYEVVNRRQSLYRVKKAA